MKERKTSNPYFLLGWLSISIAIPSPINWSWILEQHPKTEQSSLRFVFAFHIHHPPLLSLELPSTSLFLSSSFGTRFILTTSKLITWRSIAIMALCAPIALLTLLAIFGVVRAEDPYLFFTWNVTYGTLSPMGVPQRVILINGQFPGPNINSTTNNNLVINVFNNLDEPFLFSWFVKIKII